MRINPSVVYISANDLKISSQKDKIFTLPSERLRQFINTHHDLKKLLNDLVASPL